MSQQGKIRYDLDSLRDRDPKGLYSAADKGVIKDLIGYSEVNPYHVPDNAEVEIETGNNIDIYESRKQLFDYIHESILFKKICIDVI